MNKIPLLKAMKHDRWVKPFLKRYKWTLVLAITLGIVTFICASGLMFTAGYLISKSATMPFNILLVYVPIVLTRAFLNYELIEWGLIFAIILIFLIMNLKNKFGYGDTIIFVILVFYYDFYTAQYIFLLASILLLINHILGNKRNTYPFVPFIFLSLIFYNFL